MNRFPLLLLLFAGAAWNQEPVPDVNVNSRYVIEAVDVSEKYAAKLSPRLRDELRRMVGEKFDQESVDRLGRRIRKELVGYDVAQKVIRGAKPEHVRVVFEIVRKKLDQDVVLPRLVYHSRLNWSFGADMHLRADGHKVSFGIVTDNDELMERYSGIRGGYARETRKVRAGVTVASYRAQWNPAILAAAPDPSGIYRERMYVEPVLSVQPVDAVTMSFGVSVQRLEMQFPAARHELSNALITALRLHRRWENSVLGDYGAEGGYSLRAATRSLDSDFVYARHKFDGRWWMRRDKDVVVASFTGGAITGRAPLFERFALGNSSTLRGYSKYDVAPLGGNRAAHGSLDYSHRFVRLVYDVGSIWDDGTAPRVRQSVAVGFTANPGEVVRDSVSFLVGFPLKRGRVEPMFILGLNF
ncbi:MAG: BamA/TamA family outer membrane protein [Bryobacteraceae bacterium]|nr:BamA/TamA family outer membrane protein [Bryobacteraceae bacterium]